MRLANAHQPPPSLAPAADLLANAVRQLSAAKDQVEAALATETDNTKRARLHQQWASLRRRIASCNDLVTVASHPCATLILIEDRLRAKQSQASLN